MCNAEFAKIRDGTVGSSCSCRMESAVEASSEWHAPLCAAFQSTLETSAQKKSGTTTDISPADRRCRYRLAWLTNGSFPNRGSHLTATLASITKRFTAHDPPGSSPLKKGKICRRPCW